MTTTIIEVKYPTYRCALVGVRQWTDVTAPNPIRAAYEFGRANMAPSEEDQQVVVRVLPPAEASTGADKERRFLIASRRRIETSKLVDMTAFVEGGL